MPNEYFNLRSTGSLRLLACVLLTLRHNIRKCGCGILMRFCFGTPSALPRSSSESQEKAREQENWIACSPAALKKALLGSIIN